MPCAELQRLQFEGLAAAHPLTECGDMCPYTYGTHLLAITAPCCIDPAPGQLTILTVQDWGIPALDQAQRCQPEQHSYKVHLSLDCSCQRVRSSGLGTQ